MKCGRAWCAAPGAGAQGAGLPAVTLLEHWEHVMGSREGFLKLCVMKPGESSRKARDANSPQLQSTLLYGQGN